MTDRAADARLALNCMAAEAVGPVWMPSVAAGAAVVAAAAGPAPPLWVLDGGTLIGYVTGQDALLEGWLNIGARTVFYGWAIQDAIGARVIIRGTENFAEWGIDATFLPTTPHPSAGAVESGFWSLYGTLRFRSLTGDEKPLIEGLSALQGMITITGHSLGASQATFGTLELVEAGRSVRGRFFASPRPGDKTFADHFTAAVSDYAVYAYASDVVPKVPFGFSYCSLPNLMTLPTNVRIRDSLLCCHHAGIYAWLLDRGALAILPEQNSCCAACIYPLHLSLRNSA